MHVKQGFSTTYANLSNDEYGSSLGKAANLTPAKIWNNFKDILAKKEDLNTFQVGFSLFKKNIRTYSGYIHLTKSTLFPVSLPTVGTHM